MRKRYWITISLVIVLVAITVSVSAYNFPKLEHFVNDYVGVLTEG